MSEFVLIGGIACIATLALIKPAMALARKCGMTDNPLADPLKIHKTPTPCIGGLSMLGGSVVALFVGMPAIYPLIFGMVTSWIAGLIDDIGWQHRSSRNLLAKIISQLALAALMIVPIYTLGIPLVVFGASLYASYVFTLFTFVAIINAANMQDGLDGLLAGIALISGVGFFCATLAFPSPHELVGVLSVILIGTTGAFLIFNWNPAKLFMGDNGSYLVGFYLAFLLFLWGKDMQYIMSGLLMIGMPLVNELFVIVRRLSQRRSPLSADRNHIYDIIYRRVGSVRSAVLVNYAIHAMMVGAGIALLWL